MTSPYCTVVIPNYNGRDHLESCLASVLAGSMSGDRVEIVVVDNGSRDGSADWVERRFPGVRVVRHGENRGFTGAIKAGVAAGNGDILAFLNNDTRVHERWLERLVTALDSAPPTVATVTGKIVSWDGSKMDFWRGALTFDGHAFQLDFGRPLSAVAESEKSGELPFPCGGNMAVRRVAWEAMGGFDPSFFAYTEDVDFGWRCWSAGWDHRYEPGAVIHHRSGATGESLGLCRRGFLFERNAFMTVFKNLEEDLFQALIPAVLWTLVHRTWALMEQNSPDGWLLRRYSFPPYARVSPPAPAAAGAGLLTKLRRLGPREALRRALLKVARVLGKGEQGQLVLDDPRTLEQLRSVQFLLENLDHLAERRRTVQSLRKRSDRELFRRFPLFRVSTYPGDVELFQSSGFRSLFPDDPELLDRTLDEIGDL